MALQASTTWEVRAGGNNANGGGFVPGASGTDFSQQNTPQYALTGLSSSGAGAVILSAAAAANMVGNIIQVISGTNFTAGFYEITAVSVGVSITVDRAVTTGAGASGVANIGGALATLPAVMNTTSGAVAGNTIFVQSGTFTLTATWTLNVAGTSDAQIYVVAYSSNRVRNSPDALPVTITSATNSVQLFTMNGCNWVRFQNFNFTHTAGTRGVGWGNVTAGSQPVFAESCQWDGCSTGVILAFTSGATQIGLAAYNCTFKNCTTAGASTLSSGTNVIFLGCKFFSNPIGLERAQADNVIRVEKCFFYNNTTAGVNVSNTTTSGGKLDVRHSTFFGNGIGVRFAYTSGGGTEFLFMDSIVYGSTTYNFSCPTAGKSSNARFWFSNVAVGGAGTANFLNWDAPQNQVTLSGDPFTNSGAANFSLNNTAGAGAACRGAGIGGFDLGALQAAASGGVGSSSIFGSQLLAA